MKKYSLVISFNVSFIFLMTIGCILFVASASDVNYLSSSERELYSYGELIINSFPFLKGHEYLASYFSTCFGILCGLEGARLLKKLRRKDN